MTPPTPVISCRGLAFAYHDTPVLTDVTLDIHQGEAVCVVGPNGGGKTTLIRLILGLLRPQAGQVRLFGGNPADTVHRVGYVPQHTHFDPLFPVTVAEVVLMGCLSPLLLGPYRRRHRQRAQRAMAAVAVDHLRDRPFAALSGGQRQRVCIARALATEPELLILDEPTASVDPAAEASIFHLLAELNRRLTVVVVTHDIGVASQFFDTVVCVNRQVVIHPTSDLTGEMIRDLYGHDVRLIRHDHRCSEHGHQHG